MRKLFCCLQFSLITIVISYMFLFAPQLAFAHPITVRDSQVNCPSPPSNFDPSQASDGEIAYYGLPRRPQGNAQELAKWVDLVRNAKHRSCTFISSHRYSQPLISPHRPNTTYYEYSNNWSGYFAGNGSGNYFKEVEANWNVPCYYAPRSPTDSRAITWVGLGGWYSTYLWQAGTTEDFATGYHMWWEAYPLNYEQINSRNLSCGDHIQAEVDWNVNRAGQSYVYIVDKNNGDYISGPYAFTPDLQSADWIDERSGCTLGGTPKYYFLADFQYVQWSNANAKLDNNGADYQPISAFQNSQVTMYESLSPYNNMTSPGNLGGGGNNFQDNWLLNGNDDSC